MVPVFWLVRKLKELVGGAATVTATAAVTTAGAVVAAAAVAVVDVAAARLTGGALAFLKHEVEECRVEAYRGRLSTMAGRTRRSRRTVGGVRAALVDVALQDGVVLGETLEQGWVIGKKRSRTRIAVYLTCVWWRVLRAGKSIHVAAWEGEK